MALVVCVKPIVIYRLGRKLGASEVLPTTSSTTPVVKSMAP